MKRFNVNVSVTNLDQSIEFYRTLFGEEPAIRKDDYAKWMLEDPRVNFAIAESSKSRGVNHVGLQVDTLEELGDIQARLNQAGETTFDQPQAECCYAQSSKSWVRDPDEVAWETFVTFGQTTHYGNDTAPGELDSDRESRCCA